MRVEPGTPRTFGTLSRYLVTELLRIVALCLGAFLVVYLLVDFFDRFDNFLKHEASPGAIARYFLFKIPLVVTQVLPVAVLASMLMSLGGLTRNNEITAMRACGVSPAQIVVPLASTCVLLSFVALLWNEAVVPQFMRRVREIETVEIKNKELRALFGNREIWTHAEDAFFHVYNYDPATRALTGIELFQIGKEFEFEGVVSIPRAVWTGSGWRYESAVEERFHPDGGIETTQLPPGTLGLEETPEDLSTARREAEELTFFALRDLIEGFRRKGLDPTEYLVDLHLKLAVPFVSTIMGILAIPIGIRGTSRSSSLAANIGTGLAIGFSYWVVLALAVSLGHSGLIPPMFAAWAANAIFAGVGLFLLLGLA